MVPQPIARRLVPGKRFDRLPRRPRRGRVLRHVDLHHASALVGEDHQGEEHSTRHGRHSAEIKGDQLRYVMFEERLPHR
jgi:hypothetical protein